MIQIYIAWPIRTPMIYTKIKNCMIKHKVLWYQPHINLLKTSIPCMIKIQETIPPAINCISSDHLSLHIGNSLTQGVVPAVPRTTTWVMWSCCQGWASIDPNQPTLESRKINLLQFKPLSPLLCLTLLVWTGHMSLKDHFPENECSISRPLDHSMEAVHLSWRLSYHCNQTPTHKPIDSPPRTNEITYSKQTQNKSNIFDHPGQNNST